MKTLFTIIFCLFIVGIAHAQKDTLVYYMRAGAEDYDVVHFNNAMLTDSANAEFIRFIISPVDKSDTLYLVKDYNFNGKLKLMGQSTKRAPDATFEGVCVEYFANGHKKIISTYHNGTLVGDIISYFPNGHINTVKSFKKADITESKIKPQQPYLNECLDSTGTVLADSGNGKWVEYKNDYKTPVAVGAVVNGVEDGEWHGRLTDTANYTCEFIKGELKQGKTTTTSGRVYVFSKVTIMPEFPGGMERFGDYLGSSLIYPAEARDHHLQGRVISSFLVDRDGKLKNFAVLKSAAPSLDKEALRVLQNGPNWLPGRLYGLPAKFFYAVPISFTLATDDDHPETPITDTLIRYMKHTVDSFGKVENIVAPNKDSADFIRKVAPPDRSKSTTLFPVTDFYLNGKIKFIGTSTRWSETIRPIGKCTEFYPDGKEKAVYNYSYGSLVGDVVKHYANGNIYIVGYYNDDHKLILKTCSDSTGVVLTKNGNGIWIKYNDDIKKIIEQGPVKNGKEDGLWRRQLNDSTYSEYNYAKGVIGAGITYDKKGNKYPFKNFQVPAEFQGGVSAFMKFLSANLNYPVEARKNNIQGTVFVAFTIDKNGMVKNIYAKRGIELDVDQEAIRLVGLSPAWTPAYLYGLPIEVEYQVPLDFYFK